MNSLRVFKSNLTRKSLIKITIAPLILVLFIFLLYLSGCEKEDKVSQDSPGSSFTITLSGIDTVVTLDELKQFNEVSKEVSAISKTEGEITRKVKGYLLDDILKKYTVVSQKELKGIRFIAGDGYAIEVTPDILQNKEIILAYEVDEKPLEDWEKPLKSAIPGEFEMYWVKNLVRIELIQKRGTEEIERIVFIDSLEKVIDARNYKYYGAVDKVLKLDDIIKGLSDKSDLDVVFIKAIDGLEKKENVETFLSAFLKISGEDSPAFLSDEIPKGMWVKDIYYFLFGRSAYFSGESGFRILETTEIDSVNYLKLSDVFETCGIIDSEKYLLRAIDGYSVEINKFSINNGLLYFDSDGNLSVCFKELPENIAVKYLLLIEAIK